MNLRIRIVGLALATAVVVAACAPPQSGGPATGAGASQPVAKKRMLAAIFSDPPGMYIHQTQPNVGSAPGVSELWQVMSAGLTYLDDDDVLFPVLAQGVPTADNGLWEVLPNGQMRITWKLKPNLVWHDGNALTADDFVFSFAYHSDRDVGIVIPAALRLIDRVEAPDAGTVVSYWRTPFIEGDRLFTSGLAPPIPKHLLGNAFETDRASILNDSYWREGFVGAGPYKLQQWSIASHLILTADDRYALGRPKIDEIEVRFMASDLNTILANLLAGSIHTLIGRGFTLDQALQIRDMTKDVNVQLGGKLGSTLPIFTQFVNTQPQVVLNLEFRRALLMAIDRGEMNETLNYGLGQISHTWLQPDRVEYRAVVPNQRIPDREYRSQFPAFELVRTGLGPASTAISTYRSTNTPLPENGFQGANRTRYMNPAYDAMIDRYVSTIPMTERLAALGDLINHQTENLIVMTTFFEPGVNVLGSIHLTGPTGNRVFNIHQWDIV